MISLKFLAFCLGSIAIAAAAPSANVLEARQGLCGWQTCVQTSPFGCSCCPSGSSDALIVTNVCRDNNNNLVGAAADGTCPGCPGAVSKSRVDLMSDY